MSENTKPGGDRSLPETVHEIAAVQTRVASARARGATIGFVPTMGALHAGHATLLRVARAECDFVVASIFVNPLQFDRKEDLEHYPRTMDADTRICADEGVDLIFAPGHKDLYPGEQLTFVDVPALSTNLCGAFRPGHFRGVATVVLKLFNIVQADKAYFGEKDAQQLAVIRKMVQDLNVPVTVASVPTVREADGLALSSRNRHLTPEQRAVAPVLAEALRTAVERLVAGDRTTSAIRTAALERIQAYPEARVEYFEFVDPVTLVPVETVQGAVLIAGAMWLGTTRLIDNMTWRGE